jgi:hypothetical protein
MQFPSVGAGVHMTTAINTIGLAQKGIATAFLKHNGIVLSARRLQRPAYPCDAIFRDITS